MEAKGRNCHREKAIKRKAVLEKKRLIEGMIKAAYSVKDHLSCFPHLRHFQKNGLYLHLESGRGNKLSHCVKQYIQDLLKLNMEPLYGSEWPAEEKMKRRKMVADEARYIFVHEISNKDANGESELMDNKSTCNCNGPIVGFAHYRFVLEEEVPVVYIYELQLESRVRGKGLGKFLMLLIELIACENKMGAVVLPVQRKNLLAMDFYINTLRYSISAISPSRVDPLLGVDKSYEILCKTFDNEAQAVLKGERYPLHPETFVCKTCEQKAGTTSTSSSTASSKVSPPFVKRTKIDPDFLDPCYKPFPRYMKLDIVFAGRATTGNAAKASTQRLSPSNVQGVNEKEPESADMGSPDGNTPTSNNSRMTVSGPRKRKAVVNDLMVALVVELLTVSGPGKRKAADNDLMATLVGELVTSNKKMVTKAERKEAWSIGKVINLLQQFDDLDDVTFNKALQHFQNESHRCTFVALPTTRRRSYLSFNVGS